MTEKFRKEFGIGLKSVVLHLKVIKKFNLAKLLDSENVFEIEPSDIIHGFDPDDKNTFLDARL